MSCQCPPAAAAQRSALDRPTWSSRAFTCPAHTASFALRASSSSPSASMRSWMLSASSPPIAPAAGSMPRGMAARTSSTIACCPASMSAMNSSSVPARGAPPAPSQYASPAAGLRVISRPYRVISAHVCGCTQCTQVPPSSRSWPSLRSVQVRPPTRPRASSTSTPSPARPSSRAATSPANPAPMTTTSAPARAWSPRGRLAWVVTCRHGANLRNHRCVHSCCMPRGPASITGALARRMRARPSLELRDLASDVAEGPPDASGQDCNTLHTYEALRCF